MFDELLADIMFLFFFVHKPRKVIFPKKTQYTNVDYSLVQKFIIG